MHGYSRRLERNAGGPCLIFVRQCLLLEHVLKAYEGPDVLFLHYVNHRRPIQPEANLIAIIRGPGGARRSRTDDILLAKQALYQLSYGPVPQEQCDAQESCRRRVAGCVQPEAGRPGQTRTADLTLIRRTL